MTKKIVWALLVLLFVASLVLSACGRATPEPEPTAVPVAKEKPTKLPLPTPEPTKTPQPTPEPPKRPSGTLSVWHAWEDNEIESLNEVIGAFHAENPDVEFDVLPVPLEDLRDKYETAAATGGGPSVLIGAADWGPALFDADVIAEVGQLASEEFLRKINSAALGAVKYRNALIGLPQIIEGVVMYRNTSIVADAPTSFDELSAAAQAATGGDTVGASLEYGFFFAAAHLNGVGGLLMDNAGNPLFNDEKGVEWLNLLNQFKDAGPTEYYTDNDVKRFMAGQVGIIIDGTWNMAGLAEAIGADNLAIDPWPKGMSGYVQTENIYLSANTEGEDRDAAWAFLEFFLSPEAQLLLADPTKAGRIPAVSGVEVTVPLMAQAVEALAGGAALPIIPEMGAYWGPMDTALKSVFDEGANPAAALSQAYNSITVAIAQIRGEAPPE